MAQCIRCGRNISGITLGKKICVWCKQHEAAQRGEEIEYQPRMAVPWQREEAMPMLVTQALFGINVAVFIGMLLSGSSPLSPTGESLLAWGANFGPYTLTGQWWRLLTSCFVHIGIIHLAFNLWCLWSLGALAEQLYGRITFACVYLLCGISGSLCSVWWHTMPALSAGASGAIFGIAGAVIASLKLGEFSSKAMLQGTMQSLIMFVGYNVVFGALTGTTDNACHFGGLVAGVILGALIAKIAPEPRFAPRLAIMALVAALLFGWAWALRQSRSYMYLQMRGAEQIENGKIAAAAAFYEAAAKIRPESAASAHRTLGRAYAQAKDYAGAEREFARALEASPDNQNLLQALGEARLRQHHAAEARQVFTQMLAADPRSAEAHAGLGAVALEASDPAFALEEYKRAAQLYWRLPGVHAAEGDCLTQLQRFDEAIEEYRREMEITGEDAATERALAEAYRAKGATAEADAAKQRAEQAGSGQ